MAKGKYIVVNIINRKQTKIKSKEGKCLTQENKSIRYTKRWKNTETTEERNCFLIFKRKENLLEHYDLWNFSGNFAEII